MTHSKASGGKEACVKGKNGEPAGLAPAAQHSFVIHLSSSSFFFIMSLLQAGIDARRVASSSACNVDTGVKGNMGGDGSPCSSVKDLN